MSGCVRRSLLIIVPPGRGGVRDFSSVLVEKLTPDIRVKLLAWGKNDTSKVIPYLNEFDCVYLQYSGYGYAKRGAPLWLLKAVSKHRSQIKKLIVFFHELYAIGFPWSSAFWLSPSQRYIARSLADLCDCWFTNNDLAAVWLQSRSKSCKQKTLPVFSNVGEPDNFNRNREDILVVFGSKLLRERAYKSAGQLFFKWAKAQNVEIHDIGEVVSSPDLQKQLDQNNVVQHGYLDLDSIGELMCKAKWSLISYSVESLSKSGIFAAYSAHGICSIVISTKYTESSDKLTVNSEFLDKGIFKSTKTVDYTEIGVRAWQWYIGHNSSIHVKELKECLRDE